MQVILPLLPDPTDVVIQGEQLFPTSVLLASMLSPVLQGQVIGDYLLGDPISYALSGGLITPTAEPILSNSFSINLMVDRFGEATSITEVSAMAIYALTEDIAEYNITRGSQYYNAAAITLDSITELEIGTLTAVTYKDTDSVWLWASVIVTVVPYLTAKGDDAIKTYFRIRRNSIDGTIVTGTLAVGQAMYYNVANAPPLILICSDVPGGPAGERVYKLTAQLSTWEVGATHGHVAYRMFMEITKSR